MLLMILKGKNNSFFSCISICPPAGRFCCIFDLNFRLNGRHSMLYDLSLVFFCLFLHDKMPQFGIFSEGNFRNFCFTVFSMVLKLLEVVAGLVDLLLEPSHYCCDFIKENDSFLFL